MKDYLAALELVGLTSRIKRLSDDILYSTREYYKTIDVDIEPNWHLIFILLEKHETLTITEISEELRMSHPACIKIVNKMKRASYLNATVDENDSRRQLLKLTKKAHKNLPIFHRHWNACIETMRELTAESPNFLADLTRIEQKIIEKDYKERTLLNFEKQ